MTSKKPAKTKRTNLPREFTRTKEFTKDWQRIAHSGRYDMNRLKKVMLLLIENAEPLPAQYLDHALTGEWANHRECHIGGDFLLIYKLEKHNTDERIIFIRAGTHAELFE